MRIQENTMWTNADFLDGRCGVQDIGCLKGTELQEVSEVLEALPPTTMAELKQAALRVARGKMGFDKFLETYPAFHHKILLAMTRESAPPVPMQMNVNLSWISNDRLSYRRAAEIVEEVPPKE